MTSSKLCLLCLLGLHLSGYSIQEGTFEQYTQAEQRHIQPNVEADYHYPLLDQVQAPTPKKKLSLQEQMVNFFGTFVTSSPYPGVRATFEGTELMSQLSSVNKDLQILLELEKSNEYIKKHNIPYPQHPRIFLSGQVEMTALIQKDATSHPESDIDLTGAELDFLIVGSSWLYSYMSLQYDNSADSSLSNNRISNSRIKADSLFISFGDFMSSPWYLTLGQTYIPFGQYSTYRAIFTPLTRSLFRILQRDVALGFYNHNLQLSVYAFRGPSDAGSGNNINNYGVNCGLHFQIKELDAQIGIGAIRNISDSQGMQQAFGAIGNSETLRHVVPGLNINTNLTWKNWHIIGEYNQALVPFNPQNMAFSSNGIDFKGAMPKAFDVELAYTFKITTLPSSIAFAYSRSYQALGFNVPKDRMTLTWALYVFKQTLLSLEINSDKLYSSTSRATGELVTGNPYFINSSNLGHRDYTFGIDFLMYF